MTEREKVVKILSVALSRLESFCDPTDRCCGVDGIAREESRLYLESWVIPHVELAISVVSGEAVEQQRLSSLVADSACRKQPSTASYINPFSKLRLLHWAERFHRSVVDASSALNAALENKESKDSES